MKGLSRQGRFVETWHILYLDALLQTTQSIKCSIYFQHPNRLSLSVVLAFRYIDLILYIVTQSNILSFTFNNYIHII